jgi:spermidine/putrescine transport system substrate-binding protein
MKNRKYVKMSGRRFGAALMLLCLLSTLAPKGQLTAEASSKKDEDVITLRVCNWEEYIDLGGWDWDETIDLDSGDVIGVDPMYEDFEEWYYKTYGKRVEVSYSCFGTNEELYNMLTLGDVYDIVCPSEYMIMKMMAEDMLVPFSDEFFDENVEENYYAKGVSPFIKSEFETNEIDGEPWAKYAAGYMWGITGIIYNPEMVSEEEASTWSIIDNDKFCRQVTIKDNVRDSYFAAVGALKSDLLTSESFVNDPDYGEKLAAEMNDVSDETIDAVRDYLQQTKENVYSFETDSGKADMITGKVAAGYQWSGDAVYAMDQADEDDFQLNFAVPVESTNLYFDGWVMLKSGIGEDAEKQQAAEAFINFLSMPENVVRNMYYIGYTSVISGGDSDMVFDYLRWCYEAEDDEEDVVEYPLGYFFSGDNSDEDYIITAPAEQTKRQLAAQYPNEAVMARSAIMEYFDSDANAAINQMWIDVRCFNIKRVPVWAWAMVAAIIVILAGVIIWKKRKNY